MPTFSDRLPKNTGHEARFGTFCANTLAWLAPVPLGTGGRSSLTCSEDTDEVFEIGFNFKSIGQLNRDVATRKTGSAMLATSFAPFLARVFPSTFEDAAR